MTRTLLLDYGGVLNVPVDPGRLTALGQRLGADDGFTSRFFTGRREFDRGQPAADFWRGVVGRDLDAGELASATAADIALWGEVDPVAAAATLRAAAGGLRLALLSNMPHAEADAYERMPWTEPFDLLLFSCRLGLLKPDPAIFHAALAALQADPADVVFLDDRADNVAAARALGIDARVCDGAQALSGVVDDLLSAL